MTGQDAYDGPLSALRNHVGDLGSALAEWERRDDSQPQPGVRRAANTAMDAIDGMLRDLYALRARLTDEIRASDDATAARADALLARMREDGEGVS